MVSWRQIFHRFKGRPDARLVVDVDDALANELRELAEREGRAVEALADELLSEGAARRREAGVFLERWQRLTPREQQVAALMCLNYTNQQAAVRLGLSPETIKTYAAKVLVKFELKSKVELRQALAGWDFDTWAQDPPAS